MPDEGVLAGGNSGIPPVMALSLCSEFGVFGHAFLNGGASDLALQYFLLIKLILLCHRRNSGKSRQFVPARVALVGGTITSAPGDVIQIPPALRAQPRAIFVAQQL